MAPTPVDEAIQLAAPIQRGQSHEDDAAAASLQRLGVADPLSSASPKLAASMDAAEPMS
jgi:hypothetical protein